MNQHDGSIAEIAERGERGERCSTSVGVANRHDHRLVGCQDRSATSAPLLARPAALSVAHPNVTAMPPSHCPLAGCRAGTGSLDLLGFPPCASAPGQGFSPWRQRVSRQRVEREDPVRTRRAPADWPLRLESARNLARWAAPAPRSMPGSGVVCMDSEQASLNQRTANDRPMTSGETFTPRPRSRGPAK